MGRYDRYSESSLGTIVMGVDRSPFGPDFYNESTYGTKSFNLNIPPPTKPPPAPPPPQVESIVLQPRVEHIVLKPRKETSYMIEPSGRLYPLSDIALPVTTHNGWETKILGPASCFSGMPYIDQQDVGMNTPLPPGVVVVGPDLFEDREDVILVSNEEVDIAIEEETFQQLCEELFLASQQGQTALRLEEFWKERVRLSDLGLTTQATTNHQALEEQIDLIEKEETLVMNAPQNTQAAMNFLSTINNNSQLLGADQAKIANELVGAIANLQTGLPIDHPLAIASRNFANVVASGGDPTTVVTNLQKQLQGSFVGNNWGLNLQTLLAIGGAAGSVALIWNLLKNHIDWAGVAKTLQAQQEKVKAEEAEVEVVEEAQVKASAGPAVTEL